MKKLYLLVLILVIALASTAVAETDYAAEFEGMTVEELQAVDAALHTTLNAKIIEGATIDVTPETAEIAKGEKLTPEVTCDGRDLATATEITYTSSDEEIVKMEKGKITAVGAGTATVTVTATFEDGGVLEDSCEITVYVPVKDIKVEADGVNVIKKSGKKSTTVKGYALVGGTMDLSAAVSVSPEDATEQGVTYEIEDTSIATVDENGVVTGISKGETTVVITSKENVEAPKSTNVTIVVQQPVEKIESEETAFNVGNGSSRTIEVTVLPEEADDKGIVWESSAPEIVKVSDKGVVTGVDTGTATITGTAADGSGATISFEVTVITAVKKITPADKSITLIKDDTYTLSAEVAPENATDTGIDWSSSDTSIATVDSKGKVTAKGTGQAVITASAHDGTGVTATVTVYVEPHLPVMVNSIYWQTTWGMKNGKLGVVAENLCTSKTIKGFDYIVECESYYGTSSTSYLEYKGSTIKPGKEGKSKLTTSVVSGFSNAARVKITPYKVYFTDGTSVEIPSEYRYTSTFGM